MEALIARAQALTIPAREGREDPRVAVTKLAAFYAEVQGALSDEDNNTLVARLEGMRAGMVKADSRW